MTKRNTGRMAERKRFWSSIRSKIREHVESTTEIPDVRREILIEVLLRDLHAAVSTFYVAVHRAEQHHSDTSIARASLVHHCEALNVDRPPRKNAGDYVKDLDRWRRQVRRAKTKLVRAYHPDLHDGDTSKSREYQAVVEAYSVCEEYAESERKRAEA